MTVLSNARSRGLILALTLFVAALATLMVSTRANATPDSASATGTSVASVPVTAPGSGSDSSAPAYPPAAPPSSAADSSTGVAGVQDNLPPADNSNQTGPTANTGFQTLTASIIAGILLIGGGALLLLGRRRGHA